MKIRVPKALLSAQKLTCAAVALVAVATAVPFAYAQSVAREGVGRLFFTEQQRGVLEAKRQGVADFDPADIERPTFAAPLEAPKLVLRAAIKAVEGVNEDVYERDQDFKFGGIISKEGDARIIVGNQILDSEDIADLEQNLGLRIVVDDNLGVVAEDKLFKQKVTFNRGDVLRTNGGLENPGATGDRFIIVKRQ